ncbi:MAG: colanic acid biosynthesis glycosyltransferase WcaI [Proteobacteria bacterium]|nr:MAG: colanic acid biosynthesis glycosyltransferase WcaI [Pseudomonadota bacterium]
MRVVIVGLNFSPEPISTGRYSGEMATWLGDAGHWIKVVAAPPYYPAWRIFNGYRRWWYQSEIHSVSPFTLQVVRCPTYVPARPSALRRIVHLLSFAASSAPVALAARRWRPDIVLAVAPTILALPAAWAGARLAGCPVWLHVQDFEVGAAQGAGILKDNLALRLAARWERGFLRRCDRVSTISGPMMDSLARKGVAKDRRVLLPNWANTEGVYPAARSGKFLKDLGIAADQQVVLYAGNMGEKQGLELVLEAARRLASETHLVFVMAGDGAARSRLEQQGRDLPNVRWLPVQPSERLNELLNLADVHVLPQRADVAGVVMPSKLTNMLASGRPVVATASPGMAIHEVVAGHNAGVVVEPGDVGALAAALLSLAADAGKRVRMGRNARAYAEDYLNKESILAQLEKELYRCVKEHRRRRAGA